MQPAYLSSLVLNPWKHGDVYTLAAPLVFQRANGDIITVPISFPSDGATVPWPVSLVLRRWSRDCRKAPVVHDWLCVLAHMGNNTLRYADDTFHEAMLAEGTPAWKRVLYYRAVRAFHALTATNHRRTP